MFALTWVWTGQNESLVWWSVQVCVSSLTTLLQPGLGSMVWFGAPEELRLTSACDDRCSFLSSCLLSLHQNSPDNCDGRCHGVWCRARPGCPTNLNSGKMIPGGAELGTELEPRPVPAA